MEQVWCGASLGIDFRLISRLISLRLRFFRAVVNPVIAIPAVNSVHCIRPGSAYMA
jgi:hypothetical protein